MMHTRNALGISALLCLLVFSAQAQYMADLPPVRTVDKLLDEGDRAYRAGDPAKAIRYYGMILQDDPTHLNALLNRGFCYSMLREYVLAVQDFSAVLAQQKDHIPAYTSRSSAYAKMEQFELAIADLNKVLALDPKNQEAFNNRGWARKGTGDMKAACSDWQNSKQLGNAEAKIILKNNRCR